MRFSHIIFSLLFLVFSISGYSQAGTYNSVSPPTEAISTLKNSDGVYVIPALRAGTRTIKLKRSKKVVIIINKNTEREETLKGHWIIDEGIIEIKIETGSKIDTIGYTILKYDSGIFLKKINVHSYYKKE